MTVENSDRFLIAFNRIDHTMQDIIGAKDFIRFYRLIDWAKKKSAIVRKYEGDLRSYADYVMLLFIIAYRQSILLLSLMFTL